MYDFVFITHLPSFYKVNLYNALANKCKVMVIFIASGSEIRNNDFTNTKVNFDSKIINDGDFEKRNKIISSVKLIHFLASIKFKQLILGGWDLIEFWLSAFFVPYTCNALALESSVYDSAISGIKGKVKKVFLSRVFRVYCSGKPHMDLLDQLKYTGDKVTTMGVGILNREMERPLVEDSRKFSGRLVYVGRLSEEKGLDFLIQFLSEQPQLSLSIIGDGPIRHKLQSKATENITFHGYVENHKIGTMLSNSDVFILPSVSEPWGLVVEEALYFGLPVICSDHVGSSIDLVKGLNTGCIFELNNFSSLKKAIEIIAQDYDFYLKNVGRLDFEELKDSQVGAYIV